MAPGLACARTAGACPAIVRALILTISVKSLAGGDACRSCCRSPSWCCSPFSEALQTSVAGVVSGYIRLVDIDNLMAVARVSGLQIRVLRRVRHFVPAGIALLVVASRQPLQRIRPVSDACLD